MTQKCKRTPTKVFIYLLVLLNVMFSVATATTMQHRSDHEQSIVESATPPAEDVAELMSYARGNTANEANEPVIGDINEQMGGAGSEMATEAEAEAEAESQEMRWKQTKTNFDDENGKDVGGMDKAKISDAKTNKGGASLERKVSRDSADADLVGDNKRWFAVPGSMEDILENAQSSKNAPNTRHLKRQQQQKRTASLQRMHVDAWQQLITEEGEHTQHQYKQHQHKHQRHAKNAKYLRQQQLQHQQQRRSKHKLQHTKRRWRQNARSNHQRSTIEPTRKHRQQQKHKHQRYEHKPKREQQQHHHQIQGKYEEPDLKRIKPQYEQLFELNHEQFSSSAKEGLVSRADDELELPALRFAETNDWQYQNDEANIAVKPVMYRSDDVVVAASGDMANEQLGMVADSWGSYAVADSVQGMPPESAQYGNYTFRVMSNPETVQQLQQQYGKEEKHYGLQLQVLAESQTKPHNHHVTPPPLPLLTTFLPLLPTKAYTTHLLKYEPIFGDHNRWQTYAAEAELHAAPRSGRHRSHHVVTPTPNAQQPFAGIVGGGGIGGSKVFRSLPESEDFNFELHRILALQPQRHWPVKREAIVEGDVILGGLMMVHSREDTVICGPIMPQGGIQALEAMLYTIDRINEASLLPNITLGAHILDDCDKDSYGLEMAVDFIKGSISNIDDAEYHCNKTQVRKVISGVVGAASSVTSIQVANLLRLFRIPQVSFFSTSPELSNKQRFEYFSRTIPSDHYQVKAMVEIVKRMGWSYVSIIYEESNYGIKAFEELEELLARNNICIAVKEKLVKDSGVADENAYDNIVLKLLTKPRARGAIIFGSDQEVREVMRAVRRNNATGAFSWIGSDGWSARNLVSDGNEPEVEGTLSVQPQANPVKGFEEYFLNLTVENNQRNPWFVEFWEDHFQCRYPGSFGTPYNSYNSTCTTKERLSKDTDFEDQLQFVSDAVMAFAYALRDMHRDLCGGRPSLCDAMRPTKGADLLKYLRKVQFQGLSGDHFRFDVNGDGPARYNIIHFKQSAAGLYHWVKVGEYYEGELRLNMTEVQFKLLHPKPPESVCSLPCERGQAKKYVEGESCCWHCFNCSTYQIRHPIDETQCLTCQLGTLPDATKQFCQTIPEVYLRPESAWAIGAMAFSATGILVTLFVVGVFVRHNDTPIVRASGRELSYILLAGILMCYAVTFALVLKPTNIVCAIQRFSVGFCFTVVYAALLTKTNRIARIFKAGKQSAKRPSFISPKSQLVICFFLIFIQILINGVWMVIAPSHAMYHHPTREDNMLVCDSYIDASYMIAFFYPIVLIVICTVYAVLTRKIPEAFNESKHIGFTMYTTCVIWLAFVPLYFGTANHVPLRITSMSVTISLSASVTVACLFSPKLYIILIRPERNVRQSMMPPRYGNMHRTAGTGPSSMMAAAVVTAATCAQEEKIQKHITPTNTEHSTKAKKLCEMATQTITITNIFTNLDNITYSQIPYADQYVPNNNHHHLSQQQQQQQESLPHPLAAKNLAEIVANNNKINQLQHGNPNATLTATAVAATTTTTCVAPAATTVAAISTASATPTTSISTTTPPTLHALSNHVMLQQHVALHNWSSVGGVSAAPGELLAIQPPQMANTNL